VTKIKVSTYPWLGEIPLNLAFPPRWNVVECKMAGHDAPRLTEEEIRNIIQNPIGTPRLNEPAEGKKRCAVIVDDLSRPFQTSQILPFILEELHQAGIRDSQIRFVIASGCHQWMSLNEQQKKLGAEIPERFLVFNHNPFENHIYLGETGQGTPVYINREVMSCDLKISVHGIIPHRRAGFGGGSKIVLPGISSIDTTYHNHTQIKEGIGRGRVKGNMRRQDMNDAAEKVGIDFSVNQIINASRDCAALVCGDLFASYREGIEIARVHYSTKIQDDADIVVGNGYPMDNEAYKAFGICTASVREGGDVVILIHSPQGCVGHYLNGRFGTTYGGRAATPWSSWGGKGMTKPPWKMRRIIVMSPQYALMDKWYYGTGSIWLKTWHEVLDKLTLIHGGDATVAVYPCSPIQITEDEASRE